MAIGTTRLVALLRGVNVGRGNRIAMSQLRDLLTELGYCDVTTYLQSGNAIFTGSAAAAATVAAGIEEALVRLGVRSKVVVRTGAELAAALAADPLLGLMTDPAKHLVGFLGGEPQPEGARFLAELNAAPDQIRLVGRHVYLWCPAGVIASPLNKVPWDRRLGVPVTMRNWNTATKLAELAAEPVL